MAKSYQEMWEEQKRKGQYKTRDGGTYYKNPVQNQTQKALDSAAEQQASGVYKTRDNTNVYGNKHNNGGSYNPKKTKNPSVSIPSVANPAGGFKAPKVTPYNPKAAGSAVDGSKIAAQAYQQRMAAQAAEDEEEREDWKQDALQSYYDTAGVGLYRTRDNAVVYEQETTKNPNSGAEAGEEGGRLIGVPPINTTAANWQQDANINTMLDKFVGNRNQLYYTNEYGQQVAFPMQNLYFGIAEDGDPRYAAGILQMWNHPDNEIISDQYGNSVTLGDAKRAMANGLYNRNNRAAYDQWVSGYALPSNAMHYNIYANGGQGGWETVGGQGVGGGVSMADAMAAYGGQGGYGIPDYQQAVLDAQSAQYQALIDALRGQRGILDAQYDANAADLYEQYRRTDLALPEMLAGTATGVADSHILENNLNFQNNLEANELARLAAQNDLSAQINQYSAEAAMQDAQLRADYAQQAYQQRMKNQGNGGGNSGAGATTETTPDNDPYVVGVSKPVPSMNKDDVVTYLTGRFYTNLTPENFAKAMNLLIAKGLDDSVARAVAEAYGMEMV